MKNKSFVWILIIILVIAASVYYYKVKNNPEKENVCCESFGFGSEMVKTPSTYSMMPRSKCVVGEGFVGGGKNIVDNSFCK